MPNFKRCIVIAAAFFSFFPAISGWCGEATFVPWSFHGQSDTEQVATSPGTRGQSSLPTHIALAGLSFFSECISRVDGDRCPMYPTCAAYSRQVFKKHGFFVGYVMTADRLIHESNEMDYAPPVRVYGRIRYYDPVRWNDYWWYRPDGLDKRE